MQEYLQFGKKTILLVAQTIHTYVMNIFKLMAHDSVMIWLVCWHNIGGGWRWVENNKKEKCHGYHGTN